MPGLGLTMTRMGVGGRGEGGEGGVARTNPCRQESCEPCTGGVFCYPHTFSHSFQYMHNKFCADCRKTEPGGSKRDVVYLGGPIAPSYMSPG